MRSTAKKFTTIVSVILMVLACNNASSQESKKAEVYRLLIQADIMQDLDISFTYKSQSKNSCATTGRPHVDYFTTLDKNKDHDCPLDFVCVTELISYCAENYGTLECDDDGCTCWIC